MATRTADPRSAEARELEEQRLEAIRLGFREQYARELEDGSFWARFDDAGEGAVAIAVKPGSRGRRTRSPLIEEFDRWLVEELYAEETQRGYREKAARAEREWPELFGRDLLHATPADVGAYLRRFDLAKTRNCNRVALVAFFRFAMGRPIAGRFRRKGRVESNPAREVHRWKEDPNLPRPVAVALAVQLRREATKLGLRYRVVVDLGLYAGLRRSEIAGLVWSNIDLPGARLRVLGKGRRERVIPIHEELGLALQLWRLVTAGEWVFPSPYDGGHIAAGTVGDWLPEVSRSAGVAFVPHQLRHTAATQMLETGSDIRRVQEFLGHASLTSTQVYTAVSPQHLAADVAKLNFSVGLEPPDPDGGQEATVHPIRPRRIPEGR